LSSWKGQAQSSSILYLKPLQLGTKILLALAQKSHNLIDFNLQTSSLTFLGCFILIYNYAATSLATFNHHLINTASSPIFVYINPYLTLNKSVLNWTQVFRLLRFLS
jgi:hypothetical protein